MMKLLHWVVLLLLVSLLACSLSLSLSGMHRMRMGSLNINRGRDQQRRAVISEMVLQKRLNVVFLQETHSDKDNEIDWGLWWKGQYVLSHGTNFSAGVAILFSSGLDINIISTTEIVTGRALVVRAEVQDIHFCFLNIYAPNLGSDRLGFFPRK